MKNILMIVTALLFLVSCGKKYTEEQKKYIASIKAERANINYEKENDKNSPFNVDPDAVFHPLNFYDVDPDFVFNSKLTRYEKKDTVIILGSKGEERVTLKFGFLKFIKDGRDYTMTVYESGTENGGHYYSLWFTDKTTGTETYGVGRYLEFELNEDPDHIYTIDFNLAFNPYCAYSAIYSCAVPTKDDYLDIAITAGEKKFHD